MARTDRRGAGDGPPCPESAAHGNTYMMGSGRLWCPVTQSIFEAPVYDEEARTFRAGKRVTPAVVSPLRKEARPDNGLPELEVDIEW